MSQEARNPKEPSPPRERSFLQRLFVRQGLRQALGLPLLSLFTALVIGAFIIMFSSPQVLRAWQSFGSNPLGAVWTAIRTVFEAYLAMFEGAFGNPLKFFSGIGAWISTGNSRAFIDAIRPFSESLVISTPYIFAGLAVSLGFRGGLFNIGAEGQLFVGGLAAAYVGYAWLELPGYLHLPLAMAVGVLAGAVWGAIPGLLKARTGAHEVINTIQMNYIAFRLTDYLLSGPMARPDGMPMTPEILPSAYLPALLPRPVRLHWGFFLALGVAALVYWYLWKTTQGMEVRMVGANAHSARYAGVRVGVVTVITMALSGALGGLAGATQILGVDHRMVRAFSTGYGFDAIALALLGNSHPLGVVLASLLFGFLRGGAARMQSVAEVPVEIIRIIQGLVIVFVAAPEIMRSLYRLKAVRKAEDFLSRGWGSS